MFWIELLFLCNLLDSPLPGDKGSQVQGHTSEERGWDGGALNHHACFLSAVLILFAGVCSCCVCVVCFLRACVFVLVYVCVCVCAAQIYGVGSGCILES